MSPLARDYYSGLSNGYDVKIRQLVPRYDDMVEELLRRLSTRGGTSVLDLGAGAGNVTRRVLESLPDARVVAVEMSIEMATEAARTLAAYGKRVTLVTADLREFDSRGATFDAIYSNLVLHNLGSAAKRDLLRRVAAWLSDDGLFVWGDLVRYDDRRLQSRYVAERMAFARSTGCSEELIAENFAKELEDDNPWTAERMIEECGSAGFTDPQCVWRHDTFAIILARMGHSESHSSAHVIAT